MVITKPGDPNQMEGDIIEGVSWWQWRKTQMEIMRDAKASGLTAMSITKNCKGGYCKRHGFTTSQIRFRTDTGLELCRSCASIWATRTALKLPNGNDDL